MTRECECPDYAVRCAHWDGRVLWLGDQAAADQLALEIHQHPIGEGHRWNIGEGAGVIPCRVCPSHHFVLTHPAISHGTYDDFAEAEAAFFRREAELLGREVEA